MLHIWGYILKVHELIHICVTINLRPSSAVEMSLKVDQNMHDKVLIYPTMLAPKWTGSSTFGYAERPPEVARSAVGPRHRLGTLRRDVEKCLKTPCV